jgi:hypothetical protein
LNRIACVIALLALSAGPVAAQQQIMNGGFESGLTGWSTFAAPGSNPATGRYYLQGTDLTLPVSGLPALLPLAGAGYGVADQTGPGAGALYQSFVLGAGATSATLSFWMYIANSATQVLGNGFNFTSGANQNARVDLLSGTPVDPLALGSAVLFNAFIGGNSFGWTFFTFDVSSFLAAPGAYTLRFAEVDNQSFFSHGIDDVSLVTTATTVPEPTTLSLCAFGCVALAALRRRRKHA